MSAVESPSLAQSEPLPVVEASVSSSRPRNARVLALFVETEEVTDWREAAACRGIPLEVFFPPGEDDIKPITKADPEAVQAAKDICAMCRVKPECLAFALDAHQKHGVLGGLTGRERQNLINARSRARKAAKKA